MNTQYRQYEVNYLPWAPFDWDYIGGELRLGKVVFRPLSDDALQGIDQQIADYLRLYFSRYRDLYNDPVNTITLCHYAPEHRGLLEPMSDAQRAEFAGIIDTLTFCCIWGELREALNRGWRLLPPPNSETLECRAHRFSPDVLADPPMVTLVTHGLMHTEQVDKIFFQIPLPAHHRGKIQPNMELMDLLNHLFAESFDPKLRERILRSLRWFRVAHRQVQALDAEIQIVEICTALEVLLNLQRDRNRKNNPFVQAVEQWITATEGEEDVVRVEESANQQRSSLTTKAGLWAQNFYKLRNAIVHEGIQSDELLYYPAVDAHGQPSQVSQLSVASLVYGALLIQEIDAQVGYLHPAVREAIVAPQEGRAFMNQLYKRSAWGVRDCLERLGWVRPFVYTIEEIQRLREHWTELDEQLGNILSSEQIIAERQAKRTQPKIGGSMKE
jgi:hypothetical protein